jgi:hypothetical protein
MEHRLRVLSGAVLILVGCVEERASAQSADLEAPAKRHRVAGELGGFLLAKEERPGVAFGVGYGYRPASCLEVGAGFRYLVRPAYTTDSWIAQETPAPGSPSSPPERAVEEALQLWTLSVLARCYLSLDAQARFELGLTVRAGLLGHDEKRGLCCQELALAPDVRARITRTTAIALSPQLSLATTGTEQEQSDGHVDRLFGYASVWLSVVQAF